MRGDSGNGTLGLKCANPESPVVALIGDGSFSYNPVLAGLVFLNNTADPS